MKVKIQLAQVRHGSEYEGEVSFDERTFKYRLHLNVPISRWDDEGAGKGADAMLTFFDVFFKNGENEVRVSDKLKRILVPSIVLAAVEFYNHPQTESTHAGIVGAITRGSPRAQNGVLFGLEGATATIGMQRTMNMREHPLLTELLETYKSC